MVELLDHFVYVLDGVFVVVARDRHPLGADGGAEDKRAGGVVVHPVVEEEAEKTVPHVVVPPPPVPLLDVLVSE